MSRIDRRSPVAPSDASAAPAQRGLRILLVEDNADSADSLAHLLARRGHETHIARDGNEGLASALALRPDVVLLDIGLPGLDGFEVARRLRGQADSDGMLLVGVSGYGQEADRESAREAGFDHLLVKPIKLDELSRVLACVPAQRGT